MRPDVRVHLKRLILPVYTPMFLLSAGVTAPVAAFPQYLGGLGASLFVTAGIGAVGLIVMVFVAPETLHLADGDGPLHH